MKLAWPLGLLIALGFALDASCGAMTLEPLPPEEPLPEAAPPPRLVRPDAGAKKGAPEEGERP
jgi:hypothetical protein